MVILVVHAVQPHTRVEEIINQLVSGYQRSSENGTEGEHLIYETPEASHLSPGVLRNYIWKPLKLPPINR